MLLDCRTIGNLTRHGTPDRPSPANNPTVTMGLADGLRPLYNTLTD